MCFSYLTLTGLELQDLRSWFLLIFIFYYGVLLISKNVNEGETWAEAVQALYNMIENIIMVKD